jgi:hypothetical protein
MCNMQIKLFKISKLFAQYFWNLIELNKNAWLNDVDLEMDVDTPAHSRATSANF